LQTNLDVVIIVVVIDVIANYTQLALVGLLFSQRAAAVVRRKANDGAVYVI